MSPPPSTVSSDRVLFGNTFDGLRRALINANVPLDAIEQGFAGIGIRFGKDLAAAYPAQRWVEALHLAGTLAFPTLDHEARFHAVGRMVIDGFTQTVLGGAVLALARLVGPARTVKRMTHNFRHSDNFSTAEVTELGPTTLRVALNEDFGLPSYSTGLFLRIVELSGGKEPTVTREPDSVPPALTLLITWART
jgi:uncharacterized protein (TIGR02265 family)